MLREEEALTAQIADLLGQEGGDCRHLQLERLSPDGSLRRFYRLHTPGDRARPTLLAILPPEQADAAALAEAQSVVHIGRHLHRLGMPTPAIYAWEQDSGLVLCEDFGTCRLHGSAVAPGQEARRFELYDKTLQVLVRMQVRAAQGFNPDWCWDTPRYDARLMQERESGYFLTACCRDLLRLPFDADALAEECQHLAMQAAQAPAHFFLHRDCQSRNIMLPSGNPGFIDFQGGRLGPLAYDPASLLLDPYAALPAQMQEELLQVYLKALERECGYDPAQFRHEYPFVAVHRAMQITGAFAFLSRVRGKAFFAPFLAPATAALAALLAKAPFSRYPELRRLSRLCCHRLHASV